MSTLHDVKPQEVAGRDTTLRFNMQHQAAAYAALEVLESGEVDRIYCDYHDDFVVIRQVTIELYNTEQKKTAFGILSSERAVYFRMEAERDRIQDRIAILSHTGHADLEFNKLRLTLRSLIVKWLDILDTKNVKRDVDIDLDFRITFGGEKIEQIAGSTKIRVVLAIHAALFEEYLKNADRPFRFLILDTPKQQEIQTQDLADYLVELSKLAGQANGQLVFSTTEYRFPCGQQDAEWIPTFEGPEQKMYLGPVQRTL